MERKEQDLMLNIIGNQTSTLQDLMKSGLSVDNTSLEDRDTYKNSQMIQALPMFQDEQGQFSQPKFDNQYNVAVGAYNQMAYDKYYKQLMDQVTYSSQNIFAPPSKRKESGFEYMKMPNPQRLTQGLVGVGRYSNPTMSESELAQTQEVVDWKTGKKMESPNGNWFKYLGDTLVLAQYDETEDIFGKKEGEAGFDANRIAHRKGQLKLNENGTYYYETLGGRDVTGRRVLWKGDTLTTDGSWVNKHLDFFDSDDIEQNSTVGTILKNTALVGSMFLPVVGPYVALTSAAIQTAGLMGTIGRLISGNTSELSNNLEGWAKSMSRQEGRTDAAKKEMWTMEGFLNLAGDVLGQLAEQRAIFKYVPKLFNKGKGVDEETLDKLKAQYIDEYFKANKAKLPDVTQAFEGTLQAQKYAKAQAELRLASEYDALSKVNEYTKNYYDLGAKISKAYMTGVTTASSYGEAISEGANPLDAALFALGYSAAEYRLLSTGIGEWIMPELRMQQAEHKKIISTIFKDILSPDKGTSTASAAATTQLKKSKIIQNILNLGKQVAHTDYSLSKGILSNTMANALGEGLEETSEELLYDAAKQVYNTIKWFTGGDTRLSAWDNGDLSKLKDRYLMSFFGGLLGGGLAGVSIDNLKYANSINNMTSEVAMQKLVAIARDEKLEKEFLKNLDKLVIGPENLSGTKYETDENGNFIGWKPGDSNDNQALQIKQAVRQQLNFIHEMLNAEGAKFDDNSILKNVIKDVRFAQLTQSHAGERVISKFNDIMTQLYKATQSLKALDTPEVRAEHGDKDQESKGGDSETTKAERSELEAKIKELIQEKEDLLSGKYSPQLAVEAMIEMNPYLYKKLQGMSFLRYAELRSGKQYNEIPENLINQYISDYKKYQETTGKDEVALLAQLYIEKSSELIPDMVKLQEAASQTEEEAKALSGLTTGLLANFDVFRNSLYKDPEEFISQLTRKSKMTFKPMDKAEDLAKVRQGEAPNTREGELFAKTLPTLMQEFYTEEDLAWMQEAADQIASAETPELKQQLMKDAESKYLEMSVQKLVPLVESILQRGYLNSVLKNNLSKTLIDLSSFVMNHSNVSNYLKLRELIKKLDDPELVKHTPIQDFLDTFRLSENDDAMPLSNLLDTLRTRMESSTEVTDFLADEALLQQLDEAITATDIVEGILYGARTDKLGIDIVQDTSTREYDLNSNYFGINVVAKNLAEKYDGEDFFKSLPTIDGRVANEAIQDLALIKSQLIFYKDLFNINNNQKLSAQNRVETNLSYLLYKHMKNFVIVIPDGWKDKDKLEAVLDGMTFTKEHYEGENRTLSLDQESQTVLEKERIDLMKGVYDFFAANEDKVNDENELSKLLNPSNFDLLFDDGRNILTENTTSLPGRAFITWLASVSAINPESFYKAYNEVTIDKIAPIPGQELGVLTILANCLNGNHISKFVKATKKGVLDYFLVEDPELKKQRFKKIGREDLNTSDLEKYIINQPFVPKYTNTIFIEGIPGSGKTQAVLQIAKAMLTKITSLKGAWYIHTDSEHAKNGLDNKGETEEAQYFGHDKLLTHISNYNKPVLEKGVLQLTEGKEIIFDQNGQLQAKVDLKNIDKLPPVIIIDEVSKYNTIELGIIDHFAAENGITVIALGDLDQSPSYGIVHSTKLPIQARLDRGECFGPMKLGSSFRITNIQKSKNLDILTSSANRLRLHWYKDKNTRNLYGEQVCLRDEVDQEQSYLDTVIIPAIDDMIATLKNGEKIGFIHYNKNSKLAQALLNDSKYSEYLIPYENNPAQGDEAQYFIIELPTENSENAFEDFYTAATRSAQATLIYGIGDTEGNYQMGEKVLMDNTTLMDKLTYTSEIGPKTIENFSSKKKERTTKALEGRDIKDLALTKRNKTTVETIPENPTKKLRKYLSPMINTIEADNPAMISGVEFSSDAPDVAEQETTNGNIPDVAASSNLISFDEHGNVIITPAMYTHASQELGLRDDQWDSSQQPIFDGIPQSVMQYRLDTVFGLMKLLNDPNRNKITIKGRTMVGSKPDIRTKLTEINDILLGIEKKSKIESKIKTSLNLSGPVNVTFAIKESRRLNDDEEYNTVGSKYDIFSKGRENLDGIYIQDEKAHIAKRRQIVAAISENGKEVLEVPIGTLSSPITYINTTDSDGNYILPEIQATFREARRNNRNIYEALDAVISRHGSDPKYRQLIQLCRFWVFTGNLVVVNPDPNWTPAKDMANQGPQVDQVKGLNQEDTTQLMYNSATEPPIPLTQYLMNPRFRISDILVARTNLQTPNGTTIPAGNPMVLWSDSVSKENLVEQFMAGNKEVKYALILPPSYSVKEYLTDLINLSRGDFDKLTVGVGNLFTAYSVIKGLYFDELGNKNPQFENFVKAHLDTKAEGVLNVLDKVFKWIEETITVDKSLSDREQAQEYNRQLQTLLVGKSDLFDITKDKWIRNPEASVASQFQNILILLTQSTSHSTKELHLIPQYIEELDAMSRGQKVSAQISIAGETADSNFLRVVNDNYMLNGRPFMLPSKLTTRAFVDENQTISKWIDYALAEVLYEEDVSRKSKHNNAYINGNISSINNSSTSTKTVAEKLFDKLGYNFTDEFVAENKDKSLKELIPIVVEEINSSDDNILAIPISETSISLVTADGVNFSNVELISDITWDNTGKFSVQVKRLSDESEYVVTGKRNSNTVEVAQVVTVTDEGESDDVMQILKSEINTNYLNSIIGMLDAFDPNKPDAINSLPLTKSQKNAINSLPSIQKNTLRAGILNIRKFNSILNSSNTLEEFISNWVNSPVKLNHIVLYNLFSKIIPNPKNADIFIQSSSEEFLQALKTITDKLTELNCNGAKPGNVI